MEDTGTDEEDTASDGLDTASDDANPDPDTDVGGDPSADVVDDPDAVDTDEELVETNEEMDAADTDAEPVYTPEEQVDAFEAGCAEAAALYCDAAFDPACAGETSHLARLRAARWSTPPALDVAACTEGVTAMVCGHRSRGILAGGATVDVDGLQGCVANLSEVECAAVLTADFTLVPCDHFLEPASSEGDVCFSAADCVDPSLTCVGEYSGGVCASALAEGEPCSQQGCEEGLVCIDSVCHPMLGEGDACHGDIQCDWNTLYCENVDVYDFACVPKVVEGGTCRSHGACDVDLYCSVDHVCTAVE